MTDFTIDASDLLRWGRYLDSIPRRTNAALARALNTVGDGVEREVVEFISAQTGIDPNDVRRMLAVSPAKPGNLTWELDASVAIPDAIDWSRPWADRGTDAKTQTFDTESLVVIKNMEDDRVCPICIRLAEESPYTLAEAQQLIPAHPGRGGLPSCRCVLAPFVSYRRLPVEFGRAGTPPQLVTLQQLGRIAAQELRTSLKISSLNDISSGGD